MNPNPAFQGAYYATVQWEKLAPLKLPASLSSPRHIQGITLSDVLIRRKFVSGFRPSLLPFSACPFTNFLVNGQILFTCGSRSTCCYFQGLIFCQNVNIRPQKSPKHLKLGKEPKFAMRKRMARSDLASEAIWRPKQPPRLQ